MGNVLLLLFEQQETKSKKNCEREKIICPILAIESPEVIEPVLKVFISPKMGSAWIHATFQFPFFGQTQINFFPLLAWLSFDLVKTCERWIKTIKELHPGKLCQTQPNWIKTGQKLTNPELKVWSKSS